MLDPHLVKGDIEKKNQLSDANVTDDNKIISNAVLTWIIKQWGIHFWWEESNEEVKVVDPESICDYVPALIKDTNDSVHWLMFCDEKCNSYSNQMNFVDLQDAITQQEHYHKSTTA